MGVRYARWFPWMLLIAGGALLSLHIWLGMERGRYDVLQMIAPAIMLLISPMAFIRQMISYRDGELGMHNLLGMRLVVYPRERLSVTREDGGRRVLHGIKENGRKRKVLATPSWLYMRSDADQLMDTIEAELAV